MRKLSMIKLGTSLGSLQEEGQKSRPGVRHFGRPPKCRTAICAARCPVFAFVIPVWLASNPKFGLRRPHHERATRPFP